MRRSFVGLILCCLFLTVAVRLAPAAESNWPAWRGPQATGVAPDCDPPIKWSETENIKWKQELPGSGTSTPIIWGDKIFLLTSIETEKVGKAAPAPAVAPAVAPAAGQRGPGGDRPMGGRSMGGGSFGGGAAPTNFYKFDVLCLDRATGEIVWQKTAREVVPHEGHHRDHGYASYSPVTDGERLWVSFGSRGLYCFDLNGNLIWSKDLPTMISRAGFGEGASPCVVGDALVVVADQEEQSLIFAFNKATGDELWKKERDERTSWSTPAAVQVNGRLQAIVSATKLIRSYDVLTGDIVWECAGQTDNVVPAPVVGHGMVFCLSGYRGNALQAIKLDAKGVITGSDAIVWEMNKATPYVPSPLLYGDRLYFCHGNNAVLTCVDAKSGNVNFESQRIEELKGVYASPVGAAGRVYLTGRKGATVVLKDGASLETLAVNQLDDEIDASAAVVGDELFLRGKKSLYCVAK